jgi:hypothetical protein
MGVRARVRPFPPAAAAAQAWQKALYLMGVETIQVRGVSRIGPCR